MAPTTHTRPPSVRRRHAARVRDWRERDEIRKRVWSAMQGPNGERIRASIERVLRRAIRTA